MTFVLPLPVSITLLNTCNFSGSWKLVLWVFKCLHTDLINLLSFWNEEKFKWLMVVMSLHGKFILYQLQYLESFQMACSLSYMWPGCAHVLLLINICADRRSSKQPKWVSLPKTRTQSVSSGTKWPAKLGSSVLMRSTGKYDPKLTDEACLFNYPCITYSLYFFTQDADCLPIDQDLLQPLEGLVSYLQTSGQARTDRDEWSWRCCEENRRPEYRSADPQWAACLHSACGPCQLQGM